MTRERSQPSKDQLRQAAQARAQGSAPQSTSAAAYFPRTRGSAESSPDALTHILPQVRTSQRQVLEIAAFGAEHKLSFSATVRELIDRGLRAKDPDDDDD